MAERYDVAIIGAGIVGLATGLKLTERFPRARVIIVDKETRLAAHQTGHNSGVIHSGIYYRPGSYKARQCSEGKAMMREFCAQHAWPDPDAAMRAFGISHGSSSESPVPRTSNRITSRWRRTFVSMGASAPAKLVADWPGPPASTSRNCCHHNDRPAPIPNLPCRSGPSFHE